MPARIARPQSIPAARFVVHAYRRQQPRYTWRSTWNTGVDSAIGLLWKFAFLNGLSAKHVADLVVTAPRGQKTAVLKTLNVDLRSSQFIDQEKLAQILRLKARSLEHAFIAHADDRRALLESSDSLRYCRSCMARGLHVALFQYLFVQLCPVHGCALVDCCENCGGTQPCSLSPKTFTQPFRCVHCNHSFSEKITADRAQCDLRLFSPERERWREALQLVGNKSQLFGSAQRLEEHFSFYGLGSVSLSSPSLGRSRAEYYAFIEALIHRFSSNAEEFPGWAKLNDLRVIEVCSGRREAPKPKVAKWRWRLQRQRPEPIPQATAWDEKLTSVLPVYKALRRHVWKRVIRDHQSCVITAARQLWWDVDGDSIVSFCPVAEAYLRWRMFWECFGTPDDLFRKPRHVPFGVQAWLSMGAPICPAGWTAGDEQWVAHRVFAMDCLRHFHAWRSRCETRLPARRRRWSKADQLQGATTYWLVAAPSEETRAIRLFLDHRDDPTFKRKRSPAREHREWHAAQVRQIRR